MPADRPEAAATVVEPRRPGVLYSVAHAPRPDGDRLLIVTNDEAPEFRLMSAPVDAPGRAGWTEIVGEDPAERLMAADVFADHVVLTLRRDGRQLLRILRRDGSLTAIDVHPGVPAGQHPPGPQRDLRHRLDHRGHRVVHRADRLVRRRPRDRRAHPPQAARGAGVRPRAVRLGVLPGRGCRRRARPGHRRARRRRAARRHRARACSTATAPTSTRSSRSSTSRCRLCSTVGSCSRTPTSAAAGNVGAAGG